MTTALLQTAAFYEFGDLHLKNQSVSRQQHLSNTTANSIANAIGSSAATLSNMTINNNNLNNSISNNNLLINNNNNNTFNQTSSAAASLIAPPTSATTTTAGTTISVYNNKMNNNSISNNNNNQSASAIFQQQINAATAAAAAAAMVTQQQQKMLIHTALARAVSHPHSNNNVVSLVKLIEDLGQGHRKLERTQSEPLPQQVNTSRYKTELCRPFEEAGECKYGEKCQFAHGMHELRNLQRHPKYKTELCRTFHSVGFCPYGPRCHFVHNAEEARNHNRAVHAALIREAIAAGQPIPLSPPISMSTGSDRASPTGSLSLSPTNSMASFFRDQTSPTFSHQGFAFPSGISPPASPINLSPIPTPPPQQQQQQQLSSSLGSDDGRLPIFNQLSLDAFSHLAI